MTETARSTPASGRDRGRRPCRCPGGVASASSPSRETGGMDARARAALRRARVHDGRRLPRRAPPPRGPARRARARRLTAGAPIETASRQLLGELRRVEGPIPSDLADVARRLLAPSREGRARQARGGRPGGGIDAAAPGGPRRGPLAGDLSRAPHAEDVTRAIGSALGRALETLRAQVTSAATADALALLAIGHALDAQVDLWAAQNAAPACGARDRRRIGRRWRPSCPPSDSLPGRSRRPRQH